VTFDSTSFGDLTDRFELIEALGAGGMGTVVRARRREDGADVALKFARLPAAGRRDARLARFRREARALERLSHPNNARVLEARQDGDAAYIVMALAPGARLRDLPRPMPPARALRIGAQLCAALGEAHGLGLVHRDVKPANILVDARPGGDHVTLVDYGLARIADDATPLTSDSAVVGTANYISPEQLQGRDAEPRSDLYAVGIVLYELLAGRPPFSADTPYALAYLHVHAEPPPLALGGATGAAIEAVVRRCLAKEPGQRYASADELGAALASLGAGAPQAAARRTGRLRPIAARPRFLLAAVLATALSVAAVIGVTRIGGAPQAAPGAQVASMPAAMPAREPALSEASLQAEAANASENPHSAPASPAPGRLSMAQGVAERIATAERARNAAASVLGSAAQARSRAEATEARAAVRSRASRRRAEPPRAPTELPAPRDEASEAATASSPAAPPSDAGDDAERLRQRVLLLRLQDEARAVGR
jgi:hypothetical protein